MAPTAQLPTCHTERKNTKRERTKVVMVTVLVRLDVGAVSSISKKTWSAVLFLFFSVGGGGGGAVKFKFPQTERNFASYASRSHGLSLYHPHTAVSAKISA
jgi:hypothetical protein